MSDGVTGSPAKKGSRLSTVFWIVSGVAIALYVVLFPSFLYSVCSAPEKLNQIVPGQISIVGQQTENTRKAGQQKAAPTIGPPSQPTIEQSAKATYYPPREPVRAWWRSTVCDVKLSDFLIGFFTLVLAVSTIGLWWQTERLAEGADDQSDKMAASITEATRAATAMEGVSASLKITAAVGTETLVNFGKQMRAYLSIASGTLWAQCQSTGARLQMDPVVVNTGLTPARNVVATFCAKILPFPIPEDFDFAVQEPNASTGGTMNPRHPYTYRAIAPEVYPEETVWKTFLLSHGYALCVWGTVWYDDVSGERRHQNYAQLCVWREAGSCNWINCLKHNDGT